MPNLQRADYVRMGGWYFPIGFEPEGSAAEGWKLHIIAREDDAQSVLDCVVENVLEPNKVLHKFWKNTTPITDENDSNGGKWFVVYPNSTMQAFRLCADITATIRAMGFRPGPRPVPHEMQITPWVCTRYGSYIAKGVKDGQGGWRADNRTELKPPHVDNPWRQYIHYAWNGPAAMKLDPSMLSSFPSYGMSDIPQVFQVR